MPNDEEKQRDEARSEDHRWSSVGRSGSTDARRQCRDSIANVALFQSRSGHSATASSLSFVCSDILLADHCWVLAPAGPESHEGWGKMASELVICQKFTCHMNTRVRSSAEQYGTKYEAEKWRQGWTNKFLWVAEKFLGAHAKTVGLH